MLKGLGLLEDRGLGLLEGRGLGLLEGRGLGLLEGRGLGLLEGRDLGLKILGLTITENSFLTRGQSNLTKSASRGGPFPG